MDAHARHELWWRSLNDAQRREATLITGDLPPWMLRTLSTAGIDTHLIHLSNGALDYSVAFMTTSLRDFIDIHARDL